MPISYTIDEEAGVILTTASGRLTDEAEEGEVGVFRCEVEARSWLGLEPRE